MATRLDCDVLIAGGGNVGLAAAAALRALDLSVLVVEAKPPDVAIDEQGLDVGLRVSALGLGSRHFLSQLNAWPQQDRRGPVPYQQMQVESETGLGQLQFTAHEHGLAALGWIVDNDHLRQSLWMACEQAGVVFHTQASVSSVQAQKRYAVTQLSDGTEKRSALIVAADGARSPIRQQLNIECSERAYQQQALVAVVETQEANTGVAWQRYLHGGPLAFLPVSGERSSIVWSMPDEQAAEYLALSAADFAAVLSAVSQTHFGEVLKVGQRAVFPLGLLLAKRYVHERVVLMGDAAHRIHPQAGQGLNIGLQDAAALAELLQDAGYEGSLSAVGSDDISQKLRAYEHWRRSDDEIMVRGVDAIGRTMRGPSIKAEIAGFGMSLVNKAWPLKDLFLRHAMGTAMTAPKVFRQGV